MFLNALVYACCFNMFVYEFHYTGCTIFSMATKLLRLVADKKKVDGGDGGNWDIKFGINLYVLHV